MEMEFVLSPAPTMWSVGIGLGVKLPRFLIHVQVAVKPVPNPSHYKRHRPYQCSTCHPVSLFSLPLYTNHSLQWLKLNTSPTSVLKAPTIMGRLPGS